RRVLHSFQLRFQAQLVKAAQKLQLAPVLNGVGDSHKDAGDLLDRLVFGIVVSGIEVPRRIDISKGLFAGAGDNMLLESEIALKIVCFFCVTEKLVTTVT